MGGTRWKGSQVFGTSKKTCMIGVLEKDEKVEVETGDDTSRGGVIEIHGVGMIVVEGECMGTSSLEEIEGR